MVAIDAILDTELFSFEAAHSHPLWYRELAGFKDQVLETGEYGVSSFVYRARRAFAPAKLHAFFNKPWRGVIRAKGFFGRLPAARAGERACGPQVMGFAR